MAAVNKLSVLSRGMCSKQAVKLPVQVFGLEGRYASALFTAASKLNQLDQVEKDLLKIQENIKADAKLREYVFSPIINRKALGAALKQTCEKLKMAPATSNLMNLLADNGRLKKIDTVINSYKTIMAAHRGDVVCEVVTAKPLESSQRKELEGALKAFLKGKQSIKLTARVDPSLIGGMVVSIGDKYIDMSIASKVKLYTDIISSSA